METTDPYKELLMLEKGIHINKKMPSWEEIKKAIRNTNVKNWKQP